MKTINDFYKMKANNEKISFLTAYDYPVAYAANLAKIEMLLVGDSAFMVKKGFNSTNFATMDSMIELCQSVKRGVNEDVFIVGDYPSSSYEESNELAIRNALRFIKEGGCQAVKLESANETVLQRIKAISNLGITTIGHLGYTPQLSNSGIKVVGKSLEAFEQLFEDALNVEKMGAKMVLIESVPEEIVKQISKALKIIVLGIGSGKFCDGQLLISSDLLGEYGCFRPKFAKCYIPYIIQDYVNSINHKEEFVRDVIGKEMRKDGFLYLMELAMKKYAEEIKSGAFPSKEYSYHLSKEQLDLLRQSKFWKIENE